MKNIMKEILFSTFPTLTTDRLRLRRLLKKDAKEITALRSDKSVNEFIDRPQSITAEEANQFIENIQKKIVNRESLYWVIELKDEKTFLGTICLFNFSAEKKQAEIGFELLPVFQGRGFMQEAIASVILLGFEEMCLQRITAWTNPANQRSLNVLMKNKFRRDKDFQFANPEETGNYNVYYLEKDFC